MYLDYFKFKELPFSITPNIGFFCNLKGHQEALNTLLFSLRSGEGFIKIVGEVGAGKTLLCRKLLESLDNEFVTAYIPNPELNSVELRRAVARELGIDLSRLQDQHELHTLINDRLIYLREAGKNVVLLIDEAQALSVESLETVRLLTNLETTKTKLLQVVLFGQPELDEKLNQSNLRQLKQRISFSYYLRALTRDELDTYLFYRLAIAGYTQGSLFSKKAKDLLYRASKGIPRVINILCHKALLSSYGGGKQYITKRIMNIAVKDTETAIHTRQYLPWLLLLSFVVFILFILSFYFTKGII